MTSSGFVSLPPLSDAEPPQERPPEIVANDGWWPDVDLVQLRDAVRLDTTISTERLIDAVQLAMLDLARTLQTWRDCLDGDPENLQAVPPRRLVGETSDLVVYWTRALYSTVAADLSERLLAVFATSAGEERAESLRSEVVQHRRNARWARCDFVGRPRTTIELI